MTEHRFQDLGLQAKGDGGCACCGPDEHPHGGPGANASLGMPLVASTAPDGTVTADYLVDGMTCAHCVSSVTEELSAVDGVVAVTIDLNVGGLSAVHVSSTSELNEELVREAITEAGYSLASRS